MIIKRIDDYYGESGFILGSATPRVGVRSSRFLYFQQVYQWVRDQWVDVGRPTND